jgi:tellurite resistance protein TerC
MDTFHMLKYGLGIILIFVGFKMTFLHVAITISLGVIVTVIAGAVVLSLMFPAKHQQEPA